MVVEMRVVGAVTTVFTVLVVVWRTLLAAAQGEIHKSEYQCDAKLQGLQLMCRGWCVAVCTG